MSQKNIQDIIGEQPVEELSFEQAFTELEQVVLALEVGEHTLDAGVSLFERGQALAHHCAKLLEQAELKVKQLAGEDVVDFPAQS